jgi:hypothetical protein
MLRMKELNRTYNLYPTEGIKAILEKDFYLEDVEMDPYEEDDIIALYSGHFTQILEDKLSKNPNPKKTGILISKVNGTHYLVS